MMVIRPIEENDFPAVLGLAEQSGIGMTTLPPDEKILESHITRSIASFSSMNKPASGEYYFFVLEDTLTKKVAGCCAIKAKAGSHSPLYSYKVATVTRVSNSLNIRKDHQLLYLVNDLQGKTEICTLFLLPAYRKSKNGVLLSRSRFLFIGQFQECFTDTVFAEMRGISDEQGCSPVWESLGKYFFDMSFAQADFLTATTDKQFIADLMPREPIYTNLLSLDAQAAIGRPHQSTKPAMKILEKQGFSYTGYVDIFDGGPTLVCHTKHIKTVKEASKRTIKTIKAGDFGSHALVANMRSDFRACVERVCLNEDETVTISSQLSEALIVKTGDPIFFSPL